MSNTAPVKRLGTTLLAAMATIALGMGSPIATAADPGSTTVSSEPALSAKQQNIVRIAATTALGELMKVLDARRQRGVQDWLGRDPATPIPSGKELLAIGTANQTTLAGAPVRGPLFEFAPQADEYLKTHLFGDIFARDNLDWQSRELATVGALAAMSGVESQLQSHVRFSLNVGLTGAQLREVAAALAAGGQPDAGRRAGAAIQQVLPDRKVER